MKNEIVWDKQDRYLVFGECDKRSGGRDYFSDDSDDVSDPQFVFLPRDPESGPCAQDE